MFSMDDLAEELKKIAVWTWKCMETMAIPKEKQGSEG
jgi:hypothetical protein